MSNTHINRLLHLLDASSGIDTVDITGGAPELHPQFRHLVTQARLRQLHVMDRCNLTVLFESGQEDTATFLAKQSVEIIASLPCYNSENVDHQRGPGVFDKSILALKQLNGLGYGHPETGLILNLVYNPTGPFLPPSQSDLESEYKTRLFDDYGIVFNALFTITNMPIHRFASDLQRQGKLNDYFDLLYREFNPSTVSNLMCRNLISVSWNGHLFDCDFNQMLEMTCPGEETTIWGISTFDAFAGKTIATGQHCLGCTAGSGSSCGGTVV